MGSNNRHTRAGSIDPYANPDVYYGDETRTVGRRRAYSTVREINRTILAFNHMQAAETLSLYERLYIHAALKR